MYASAPRAEDSSCYARLSSRSLVHQLKFSPIHARPPPLDDANAKAVTAGEFSNTHILEQLFFQETTAEHCPTCAPAGRFMFYIANKGLCQPHLPVGVEHGALHAGWIHVLRQALSTTFVVPEHIEERPCGDDGRLSILPYGKKGLWLKYSTCCHSPCGRCEAKSAVRSDIEDLMKQVCSQDKVWKK